jgi:hypothetical protein
MTVTDDQVSALRAVVTGDAAALDRLGGESRHNYGEEFPVLMAVAFIAAARRHFSVSWSSSDLIKFVGRLRARDDGEYADIDASAAEQLLFAALRDVPMRREFDEIAKAYAQFTILAELVSELDHEQLETFLADAREQADLWLLQHVQP